MSQDTDSDPNPDVVQESDQLEFEDTLVNRGVDDILDEGISPEERPLGLDHWGVTAEEEREGESLDGLLAREVPDVGVDQDVPEGDGLGDEVGTDGELLDDEVGDRRSGRLVDDDTDLYATDVGIDGGAASAEEAAVHLIPDEEDDDLDDELDDELDDD